jgi:hypothetical protein
MKEVIRENLTPAQVLEIRKEAKKEGASVNVVRLHSQLVEIEIIYPSRVIDVTPKKLVGVL